MHNLFHDVTQKAYEVGCSMLFDVCPNVLLEQLNCLPHSTPETNCKTLATEVCYAFLQECRRNGRDCYSESAPQLKLPNLKKSIGGRLALELEGFTYP